MVSAEPAGRVVQVNLSGGGVPKTPVPAARVGPLGLDGDAHRDDTVHGGPLRAVCLFAIEVIERLQAEGHPIEPGAVGENLTTAGIELADLAPGSRLGIGDEVLLELTSPAMPCDTIVAAFLDGKSGRISALTHPHDTRVYARVLREGTVRAGDPIAVLPPDPASDVATQVALFRIESAVRNRHIGLWRAAAAAGHAIDIVDDGELAIATSPDLTGPPFNLAFGLRSLPQFLPLVLETFTAAGVAGQFASPEPPWPGAEPVETILTLAAPPDAVDTTFCVAGVEVRETARGEPDAWGGGALADVLRALTDPPSHRFAALDDGVTVGSGLLFTHRRIGLLTSAIVAPAARGRGIQRALIAARARRAAELHCDLVVVEVDAGNTAPLRNAERAGLREMARRQVYRYDPAVHGDRPIIEARERFGRWAPDRPVARAAVA